MRQLWHTLAAGARARGLGAAAITVGCHVEMKQGAEPLFTNRCTRQGSGADAHGARDDGRAHARVVTHGCAWPRLGHGGAMAEAEARAGGRLRSPPLLLASP